MTEREEVIQARIDQIAEQMVRDRTPTVERALRELLASDEFVEGMLDMLHVLLWHKETDEIQEHVRDTKARMCDLIALDCNVQAAARAQAKKEIDGGAL